MLEAIIEQIHPSSSKIGAVEIPRHKLHKAVSPRNSPAIMELPTVNTHVNNRTDRLTSILTAFTRLAAKWTLLHNGEKEISHINEVQILATSSGLRSAVSLLLRA